MHRSITRVVFLFALLLLGVVPAHAQDPEAIPVQGEWAPVFTLTSYNTVEGRTEISLHDYVGERPDDPAQLLLLVFVSADAPGLDSELRRLKRLQRRYQRRGLRVVAIASEEQTSKISTQVATLTLNYPVLRDEFSLVAERWGGIRAPAVFLVDRAGRIVGVGGTQVHEQPEPVEAAIRRVLMPE